MVKSTGWYSRGPGFNYQHPHSSSQMFVTLFPEDLTLSYRHKCKYNTMHIKSK